MTLLLLGPTTDCTNDEFPSNKSNKKGCTRSGGAYDCAWYIHFTILHNKFVSPLDFNRADYRRSVHITCLNLLYNGYTASNVPFSDTTSGHHVSVDRPNSSGSIHLVIQEIKFVAIRGCSYKLLQKHIQLF